MSPLADLPPLRRSASSLETFAFILIGRISILIRPYQYSPLWLGARSTTHCRRPSDGQTLEKSKSRLWFLVHSWLALPIWFFVLIVCFTGMLAVVSQEIVWLANPDVRASKPDTDAERLSFQQVLNALHKAEPDMVVQSIIQPDGSHFALTANVTFPDGTTPTLYVNPYTGAIQGKSPTSTSKPSPAPCTAGGWCPSPTGLAGAGTWCRSSVCPCSLHW